jgi:hypothetical protein
MSSCKNDKKVISEDCSEDVILLSELQTKTDYYAPINLYNDINLSDLDRILLNGDKIELAFDHCITIEESGFYDLLLDFKTAEDQRIVFTLKTPERENAEWGIMTWIPSMFSVEPSSGEEILAVYPRKYIGGTAVPCIFYLFNGSNLSGIYAEAEHSTSGRAFYIKRGVGSVNLPSEELDNSRIFSIGGRSFEISSQKTSAIDIELSGELTDDIILSENSVVAITADLHIPSNVKITVKEGALLLINEAVNIYNDGPIEFQGEEDNPIHVSCREQGKFWGGFISTGASAHLSAVHTIFTQSGYHDGGSYNWGHAQRQALFYTENAALNLDHCYMLDHVGQVFYPRNATLTLESILVQRAKTSGQLNYTSAIISNSIFTDFPDDSQTYQDQDNDALYVNASDVNIDHCIFMFAKDDGLDSGGNEGGIVQVSNSRFEACFHEGAALSSANEVEKTHSFTNCVFFNCGQGIELGFSSPNHQVIADGCEFLYNGIGIRYGDNYNWSSVNGIMLIKNSASLFNIKDVWNMVHMSWSPKIENLQFDHVQVSSYVDQYPELQIIND